MKELSITVNVDKEAEAGYRFSELPVLIGRSPECDLCICHEAVARELCTAWLEDNGTTVRVEERPGLKNPLLSGNNAVKGGVSGSSLCLTVGPVEMCLKATSEVLKPRSNEKTTRKRLILLSVIVFVLTALLELQKMLSHGANATSAKAALPNSPLCKIPSIVCESKDACLEKARLYVTRARELMSRPGADPANRVRAAAMLKAAALIHENEKSESAEAASLEAQRAVEKVTTAYQRELIAFKRTQALSSDNSAVQAIAMELSRYLEDCDGAWQKWLTREKKAESKKGKMQ